MKVPVNLSTDATDGFSLHFYSLPTQPYVYAAVPAVEEIVTHDWTLGAGKHAFTSTVFHRGKTIVQDGHDAGPLIADKAMGLPAWANGRKSFMEIASCRKISFAASTVSMNGKATGAASDDLPLMTCGEPAALPFCWPLQTTWNTVNVGLTDEDVMVGWIAIGASIAIDVILFVKGIVGAEVPSIIGALGFDTEKPAWNAITSSVLGLYRSYESGWQKPVSIKYEIGVAGATYAHEVTYDPKTHQFKVAAGSTAGPKKASAEVIYDGDDGSFDLNAEQNFVDTVD